MEPLTIATAYATIVALLGQYSSERDKLRSIEYEDFKQWLEENRHQEAIELLNNNLNVAISVKALINDNHDKLTTLINSEVVPKLNKIIESISQVNQDSSNEDNIDEEVPFYELRARAESGDSEAMYKVASKYEDDGNYEKYHKWLEKASNAGHIDAAIELGDIYISTIGYEDKEDEGVRLLQFAVDAGDDTAMFILGTHLSYDENQIEHAKELLLTSARMGNFFAELEYESRFDNDD